jgi:predicted Zn-dependent peptidase
VEKWGRDALISFWEKWYFPANAVLYIVGEFGRPVDEVKALIQKTFGAVPPGREKLPGATATPLSNGNGPRYADSTAHSNGTEPDNGKVPLGPLKKKHKVAWPSA